MTADTDREQSSSSRTSHCLVCNSRLGVSNRNSCEIYKSLVGTTERPVAEVIGSILEIDINEESIHSNVICKKCFKAFNEVDEIEGRLMEIKTDMTVNYNRTLKIIASGGNNIDEESLDDRKFPLGDENIIKRGRKKYFIKRVKIDNSEIHEGDAEQKENNIQGATDISSDQEGDYAELAVEAIEVGEVTSKGVDVDGIKIKLEPGVEEEEELDSVAALERDLVAIRKKPGRKKIIRADLDEQNIPDEVLGREENHFVCLLCTGNEKIIGDVKGISLHLKGVHGVKIYICDICFKDFRKRTDLSLHLDEHISSESGDFQCEVCNRIFNNLRLFRVHKRMHYPQSKLWTCETCGKKYGSRNLLEEHTNTHTGIRPYVCGACGKDYASKYTYKAHMKTHEARTRDFECTDCGKTFLSAQNLTQHERTHSGMRTHVCDNCGKAFTTQRNLEVHSVVHSGYKPFICRMCGKAFARKAEIRDHERTHTGEKPYQCEMCGATFSQRSNLQSHKRATHYQDKRYKCVDCGKGFKRRRLLDYHVKAAHTGERPYKCSTCEATFVYPEHFKKHRRIHTGEKPFLCEVCGKAFNSRDNRNAHRFVHSDKKPYECLVCGAGFMRKPLLYNHMQTQGHLNDTIVVNQPRLTTEPEDHLSLEDGTAMEMALIQDSSEGMEEAKLYIAELKEHVIIQQDNDDHHMYAEKTHVMVTEDDKDDVTRAMVEDGVEHLIIDGQVHFADSAEISGIGSVAEITTTSSGRHTLVVPATPHILSNADQDVSTNLTNLAPLQTDSGPVHLVHIRLPTSENGSGKTWFNIVENE